MSHAGPAAATPPPDGERRAGRDDVVVAVITGAWGVKGDVRVESFSDFPERFAAGKTLYLAGIAVKITRSRSSKGGLVLGLDSINDRTEAESHRGKELTVPRDEARPQPAGSFYHFEIIGIDVWTDVGEYLGKVGGILLTGGNDVYTVQSAESSEILLPAVKDVILDVDVALNKMVVRLPEGLKRPPDRFDHVEPPC